jgi:site-specific DNA-methyltransferase (adenine-specific)
MPSEIESAFREVCDGFSIDRVVADPQLNLKFVDACRANGLVAPATELNQQLINMRKAGKLGRLNSKPTRFDDSEYRFAVEIVVRHLERRDQVTLDDILVSPTRAILFQVSRL